MFSRFSTKQKLPSTSSTPPPSLLKAFSEGPSFNYSFIPSVIGQQFLRVCFIQATDSGIGDTQGVCVLTAESFQEENRLLKQVLKVRCGGYRSRYRLRGLSIPNLWSQYS